ncbi:MAG: hypothetical protein P4L53_05315 [Candidatus Obscuribacterales bacterium]|nr:hypothetical protein [Candidatus Obscuribacterales bacterium]
MSHTPENASPRTGLYVISQENPVQTSRRGDHLGVVDANGATIAFTGSTSSQVSPEASSATVAATSVKTVNGIVDWNLHSDFHAIDSTHGDAPKQHPLPAIGSYFSNAVKDFLADNPRAKNLLAMTEEFERAFIEAAKDSVLGR